MSHMSLKMAMPITLVCQPQIRLVHSVITSKRGNDDEMTPGTRSLPSLPNAFLERR